MARERSIVNAGELSLDKLSMSPMISEMLRVCITAVCGCTWVVCAPTDQGKTAAAEFLIHGKHSVRPTRSLKIDATNMADFVNKFAGDVLNCAAMGVTVFLMTKDADCASELIKLNDGTKCKPLPGNVRNRGYTGSQRFDGEAEWNRMDLSVEEQREAVQDFCQKHDLDPIQVIPNGLRFSPGEAMKRGGELYFEKQMSIVEPEADSLVSPV